VEGQVRPWKESELEGAGRDRSGCGKKSNLGRGLQDWSGHKIKK